MPNGDDDDEVQHKLRKTLLHVTLSSVRDNSSP
jgi:hypothetical protein